MESEVTKLHSESPEGGRYTVAPEVGLVACLLAMASLAVRAVSRSDAAMCATILDALMPWLAAGGRPIFFEAVQRTPMVVSADCTGVHGIWDCRSLSCTQKLPDGTEKVPGSQL